MREPLELPGGERVWERELDREGAVLVGHERRQKERRLDQVFPRGRGGSSCRSTCRLGGATRLFVLLAFIAVFTLFLPVFHPVHRYRIYR